MWGAKGLTVSRRGGSSQCRTMVAERCSCRSAAVMAAHSSVATMEAAWRRDALEMRFCCEASGFLLFWSWRAWLLLPFGAQNQEKKISTCCCFLGNQHEHSAANRERGIVQGFCILSPSFCVPTPFFLISSSRLWILAETYMYKMRSSIVPSLCQPWSQKDLWWFSCLHSSVLDVRLSHAVMEPWLLEDPEYCGIITNANQKTDTLNGFVSWSIVRSCIRFCKFLQKAPWEGHKFAAGKLLSLENSSSQR